MNLFLRKLSPLIIIATVSTFCFPIIAFSEINPRQQPDAPFAVVELFTSEGCSSCPSADQLLMDLTNLAETQQKRIFTLSFHVTYWNDLGWKDPFSDDQFTSRQRIYAQKLDSNSVYTPQMIINGIHAFVGSNRQTAQKHIDEALQIPAQVSVGLEILKENNEMIELQYELSDMGENLALNTALTERGIVSEVARGENAGRTLPHDNVVKAFNSTALTQKKGTIKITKPPSINNQKSSIIAYVQNQQNMKIIGANFIDLNQL